MKLKGTVEVVITVSGFNGKECGTDENICKFQVWDNTRMCKLFKGRLRENHRSSLRCSECIKTFGVGK